MQDLIEQIAVYANTSNLPKGLAQLASENCELPIQHYNF
jgi:hypothetical protein